MDHAARRAMVAERFEGLDVEAFLVTRLPNVRYLSGFTGSNGQLILTPDGGVFLTDGRYTAQAGHEVPDVRCETYSSHLPRAFAAACKALSVHRVAFESAGLTYRTYTELAETGIELVPATGEVERLRWRKDPEERKYLEDAQGIADDAFDGILGRVAEGLTERQLAFLLDTTMRELGAEAASFHTIVAFGEGAAEPHHTPTDRPLRRGDVVTLDFGATVAGYHSDMTRTVAFGRPRDELRNVYQIVRRAQEVGVGAVREGVAGGEVDEAARAIVREAGHGRHFPHPLGHGVGLEIHEGPWLRPAGEDVLPPGAVVTVEPGIYVEGTGGVRIEDMVEVTANGGRVLARAQKDLIVL